MLILPAHSHTILIPHDVGVHGPCLLEMVFLH